MFPSVLNPELSFLWGPVRTRKCLYIFHTRTTWAFLILVRLCSSGALVCSWKVFLKCQWIIMLICKNFFFSSSSELFLYKKWNGTKTCPSVKLHFISLINLAIFKVLVYYFYFDLSKTRWIKGHYYFLKLALHHMILSRFHCCWQTFHLVKEFFVCVLRSAVLECILWHVHQCH